jgi:hypothetical protein
VANVLSRGLVVPKMLPMLGREVAVSIAFGRLGENLCAFFKRSWLKQFDHIIIGHGISLFRWRSEGLKPHDMPPFPLELSPASGIARAGPGNRRLGNRSNGGREPTAVKPDVSWAGRNRWN